MPRSGYINFVLPKFLHEVLKGLAVQESQYEGRSVSMSETLRRALLVYEIIVKNRDPNSSPYDRFSAEAHAYVAQAQQEKDRESARAAQEAQASQRAYERTQRSLAAIEEEQREGH